MSKTKLFMWFLLGSLLWTSSVFAEDAVTEISLERTPCYGHCPSFVVTFKADGAAVYEGKQYVDRIGLYEASIDKESFSGLVEALYKNNFFGLQSNYQSGWTDLSATYISVVKGQTKTTIRDYGNQGPVELKSIEEAIDSLAAKTAW